MSPSELISTRCPGRLYMNRNLAARGTVSCDPACASMWFTSFLCMLSYSVKTGALTRAFASKVHKGLRVDQRPNGNVPFTSCSLQHQRNGPPLKFFDTDSAGHCKLRVTWSLMTFHSSGSLSRHSCAKAWLPMRGAPKVYTCGDMNRVEMT